MAVKLRLQRKGRKKAPFYHIVVADSRAPRDGRFIEKIGTYNPLTVPATIEVNRDRAFEWLMQGAEPTDTVNAILRFKGVLLRKHLTLGVNKGAITQEAADAQLAAWIEQKEGKIAARREESKEKKRAAVVSADGKPKVKAKPVVEEPTPEPVEESAPEAAVEAVAAEVVAEAPVAEAVVETPVAEAVVETPAAEAVVEAPAAEEAAPEAPAAEENSTEA